MSRFFVNEKHFFSSGGVGWLLTVEVLSEYQEENGNWPLSKYHESPLIQCKRHLFKILNQRLPGACVKSNDFLGPLVISLNERL